MGDKFPDGPLHLQRFLCDCTDALGETLRKSVHHPVSIIRSLRCPCDPDPLKKAAVAATAADPRTVKARQRNIESGRLQTQANTADDRRVACRMFSIRVNDEEGVIHSACRRCERLVLLYDRALYWGIKKNSGVTAPTYPYKCSCGGHAFEIALGMQYPDEALDENDIDTMTIVVRCASCNEIAVIFDDEAT